MQNKELSVLHIFSKNRDAYAAQRGYSFQHLATLKVWLENRIASSSAKIYCDYEDDIFIMDNDSNIANFKQIKLYATKFSFSSEEIKKALVNFFMLFVKADYVNHSIDFRFETNTEISRKKGDNAADVLQNWLDEQSEMSQETKVSVRTQVKEIISEYVETEVAKVSDVDPLYETIQQANSVFNKMQDEDFDNFISCISWQFDGDTPEQAMQKIKEEVTCLVDQLPFVIDGQEPSTVIAVLGQAIRDASEQENPDLRRLDGQRLDSILLAIGDEKQKWYNQVYSFWADIASVKSFNQGAFQEVIDATRYCRYELPSSGHNAFWIELLQLFIDLDDIDIPSKRKAIYEQVFIAINPMLLKAEPNLNFSRYEVNIRFYFDNWLRGGTTGTVEDDITLLQITETLTRFHIIGISGEDVSRWRAKISGWIDANLAAADTADKKCSFLQLKGHSVFHGNPDNMVNNVHEGINYYRQILPVLNEASLYSVGDLYRQTDKLIEMLLSNGSDSEVVEIVYAFMEELKPYAEAAQQSFLTGQSAIKQGALFLKAGGTGNVLKALKLFHQAKRAYFKEDLMEGHLLALLNISHVYGMLGMHLAAKKYALAAGFIAWQMSEPTYYKRIVQAVQLLFHSDFRVGAWMTALSTFQLLLKTIRKFDPLLRERVSDEFLMRNFFEIALIGYSQPAICPVLQQYMDCLKFEMGKEWEEWIQPQVEQLESTSLTYEKLIKLITRRVLQTPFSDLGPERQIRFHSLGVNWKISFVNTHIVTSIGEELVALLQVILTELAADDIVTLQQGTTVEIEVLQGTVFSMPVLIGPNKWQVIIPQFNSKDKKKVTIFNANLCAVIMAVLRSISEDETVFGQQYEQLLKSEHLVDKAFCVNNYQEMYTDFYDDSISPNKYHFTSPILPEFPPFFKTAI